MTTPFSNCRFRECDLPGQCQDEGKCHHPAVPAANGSVPVAWMTTYECPPTTTVRLLADMSERQHKYVRQHAKSIVPLYAAPVADGAMAEDAARLDFMTDREAWIAWSRDREVCRVFVRDDGGDAVPLLGWGAGKNFHTAREAIDAPIAASAQKGGR
jgi:hypothetical protein